MRSIILALALATLAAPVAAQTLQPQTLQEEMLAANRAFTLDVDPGNQDAYYTALVDGLDGDWAPVTEYDAIPSGGHKRICGNLALSFAAADPLTITSTFGKGRATPITRHYVYVGGMQFESWVDPAEYAAYTGVAAERYHALMASLAAEAGPVMIFRPSDNILVIAKGRGAPDILARCGVIDADAVRLGLAEVVDAQVPNAGDEARAAFIDCAAEAVSPLSEEDLALVVESQFNPSPADQERFEGLHPGINAAVGACMLALQEAAP